MSERYLIRSEPDWKQPQVCYECPFCLDPTVFEVQVEFGPQHDRETKWKWYCKECGRSWPIEKGGK